MSETSVDNALWASAQPRLSVLIPFKGDDPCALLAALDQEQAAAEIVVLDDGTADPALTARVIETMTVDSGSRVRAGQVLVSLRRTSVGADAAVIARRDRMSCSSA